jgi:hypothetical protein
MTLHLADETFRKAIAEAFKAGRESGIFDLEMALLGMMPEEHKTLHLINLGDIVHIYTSDGYIRLDSLIDNS